MSNGVRQSYLEEIFPSYAVLSSSGNGKSIQRNPERNPLQNPKSSFSFFNNFMKFFLDQTIGASINTVIFSIVMAKFNGVSFDEATKIAVREFWPVMRAGWKLWPAVSAFNFGFVQSVENRTMVGNVAGIAWGIYLSLITRSLILLVVFCLEREIPYTSAQLLPSPMGLMPVNLGLKPQ